MQNEDGLSPFWNTHAERVPPFALVKPTGVFDAQGRMFVTRPDKDSESGLWVNSEVSVEPNAGGGAYQSLKSTVSYDTSEGIPSPGEECGSKAGSWYAHRGQSGFKCVAAKDGIMNAVRTNIIRRARRGDYWGRVHCPGSGPIPGDPGMGYNQNVYSTATPAPGVIKPLTTLIPKGSGVVDVWGCLTAYVTGFSVPDGFFVLYGYLRAVDASGNPITYHSTDPGLFDITTITHQGIIILRGQLPRAAEVAVGVGDFGVGASWWGSGPVVRRRVVVGSDVDLYVSWEAYLVGNSSDNPTLVFFSAYGVATGGSYIEWEPVDDIPEPYVWAP